MCASEAVWSLEGSLSIIHPPSLFSNLSLEKQSFTMVNVRRLATALTALLPLASAAPTQTQQKREVIPGKYIVTLKDSASSADVESHLGWVTSVHARSLSKRDTAGVEKTYKINSWNAYAGEFDDDTLAEIKANADVSVPRVTLFPR